MTDTTPPPEDLLDAYLDDPRPGSGLPPEDAALADALLAAAESAQPDPKFAARLEARLQAAHPRPAARPGSYVSLWSPTVKRLSAFALITLVILALLIGGTRLLQPRPQPGLPQVIEPTASAAAAPNGGAETPAPAEVTTAPTEAATEVPPATATPLPAMPAQFAPGLTFPTAPATASLYSQALQPYTPDSVLAVAERMGVHGAVYTSPGEGSSPVYVVSDGVATVTFAGSADYFLYVPDVSRVLDVNGKALTYEQRAAVAANFLRAHNLLPTDYVPAPPPNIGNPVDFQYGVDFNPTVDGLALTQSISPLIRVVVVAGDRVQSVSYNVPHLAPLASLPIMSAEEAWRRANDPEGRGVDVSTISYTAAPGPAYQAWTRQYQPDEAADVFGYVQTLQPADPAGTPRVTVGNWTVQGNTAGLAGQNGHPVHLSGHYSANPDGSGAITVDSWTPVSDLLHLTGQVERRDNGAYLVSSGVSYLLPGLPEAVPAGVSVNADGGLAGSPDPRLEWSLISIDNGGGGGGGGGSSGFAEIVLTPIVERGPTPTPAIPVPVGADLADVHGDLSATLQQNADGSRTTVYSVSVFTPGGGGYNLNLLGDAAAGSEKYNYLPVRVWGKVTALHGYNLSADVQVERIEPVYPDLRIQAWLGKDAVETVAGQAVDVFSAQDGSRLVVDSSVGQGAGFTPTAMTPQGQVSIIEGYLVPDKTLDGLALVHLFSVTSNDKLDLAGYQLRSSQLPVVQSASAGPMPAALKVESIELVYNLQDLTHGSPAPAADCPCRTVQPVWRFAGHTPDGSYYEVLVQALPDAYLK